MLINHKIVNILMKYHSVTSKEDIISSLNKPAINSSSLSILPCKRSLVNAFGDSFQWRGKVPFFSALAGEKNAHIYWVLTSFQICQHSLIRILSQLKEQLPKHHSNLKHLCIKEMNREHKATYE